MKHYCFANTFVYYMEKIGVVIHKKVKERGMSNAEFARRINTHIRNVYDIYKRESIDTDLLLQIGSILNFDFFNILRTPVKDVSDIMQEESNNRYIDKKFINELQQRINELEKEVDFLKERVKDKDMIIKLMKRNNK